MPAPSGPPAGRRPRPSRGGSRSGQRARRVLSGVLVAFAGALLLRPVIFLTAAIGEDGDGLVPALAATVFHLLIFAMAVSLLRRATPR